MDRCQYLYHPEPNGTRREGRLRFAFESGNYLATVLTLKAIYGATSNVFTKVAE